MMDKGLSDFSALDVAPSLVAILEQQGITKPTEIQQIAIPPILNGRDVIGLAQTGSGKSLAFLLPVIQQILQKSTTRCLILTPTRELADQIFHVIKSITGSLPEEKIRLSLIVGGRSMHVQEGSLSKNPHFIIATPGRLINHLETGCFKPESLSHFILDEADRLLDMGFAEDIERLYEPIPENAQKLMFSATFNDYIRKLAGNILNKPLQISLTDYQKLHSDINEELIICDDFEHKKNILFHLLNQKELKQAIIFTATRRAVDELSYILDEQGYEISAIHGKMGQKARFQAVEKLHKGQALALLATDVAARGLDIRQVSHVINFDIPLTPDDYIHRIGRTGRAGDKGWAISLAGPGDQNKLKAIEELTGRVIPRVIVEGLKSKAVTQIEQKQKKQQKTKHKTVKVKNAVEEALRPQGWAKPKVKTGIKARKNKRKKTK